MKKTSYLLLIILAILALLGGIAAELLNQINFAAFTVLPVWTLLYLLGLGAHRSIRVWTPAAFIELSCGMILLYSCARVMGDATLLPTVIFSFAIATWIAALRFKKGER